MSESRGIDDRKFGRDYVSSNKLSGNISAEELADACLRFGILEPLEPLLRDVKKKNEKYGSSSSSPVANKDSARKSAPNKKERRMSIDRKNKKSSETNPCEQFDDRAKYSGSGGASGSAFGKNSYGKESWGRDSGARDLSPEPNAHRIHESLNIDKQLMDNNETGGTSAMLQLASKLQVAALSALETEVLELSERLTKSELERDSAQKRLNEALDEKERVQRRLESVGAVHESRITEMHCVIVELNKKLKFQQDNAILEDQEPDGSRSVSELSFQDGSVYNSDMEGSNFDQQSQAEPSETKQHLDDRSESHYSMPAANYTACSQVQMQAMQEEILHLRSQMALLQSKLASLQDNIDNDAQSAKAHNSDIVQSSFNDNIDETSESANNRSRNAQCDQGQQTEPKALSIASSKKNDETLRKDLTSKCNTPNESRKDGSDQEIQRLQRCAEQLRVQNNILSLSFIDSKTQCEHLYLLCSKYESNAIALNQALNLSDRTIEAYDVMLALIESKLAILESAESAIENRKAAETVAKHLMLRFENDKNMHGNSLGPWQGAASVICSGNGNQSILWTEKDDQALRDQMSKLKGQRAAVQNTVVILESPYKDYHDSGAMSKSMNANLKTIEECAPGVRKAELETAVLMEELLSLKENYSDMKYRADQAEREKNFALEALIHLRAQLNDPEALLVMSNKERPSYSETEHSTGIEMELVAALARESRLKAQLQALAASLENATKSKININAKKNLSRSDDKK